MLCSAGHGIGGHGARMVMIRRPFCCDCLGGTRDRQAEAARIRKARTHFRYDAYENDAYENDAYENDAYENEAHGLEPVKTVGTLLGSVVRVVAEWMTD